MVPQVRNSVSATAMVGQPGSLLPACLSRPSRDGSTLQTAQTQGSSKDTSKIANNLAVPSSWLSAPCSQPQPHGRLVLPKLAAVAASLSPHPAYTIPTGSGVGTPGTREIRKKKVPGRGESSLVIYIACAATRLPRRDPLPTPLPLFLFPHAHFSRLPPTCLFDHSRGQNLICPTDPVSWVTHPCPAAVLSPSRHSWAYKTLGLPPFGFTHPLDSGLTRQPR
ncbi:hypothetical protein B0T26DRAFT_454523 [Lasiosphaeria miniovina]|uniref:Uncharacterized protein n=1 Tax=Lasiosphaeria miniovina TaxID=1954250 RepID=A0AA39ZZC1_9PEZI|nr:uncharacterized protein B0T26DRAFT_454523 [Lasiosphaeria miniovina]KAK0706442.1 hypothetical protein B0T26DRAFT_454523 [Lasiosphaeria miniovina]